MPRDSVLEQEIQAQATRSLRSLPHLPIGHQRLLILADFLETKVPNERFDMTIYSNGPLNECGTAGCALGWATTIPAFQEAGLYQECVWPRLRGLAGLSSHEVAVRFFELDERGARLFLPVAGRESPRQVAARIRAFVADRAISKAEQGA